MNTNISFGFLAYCIHLHSNEWHKNCEQWITKAVETVTVCFKKCLWPEKSTCPLNHYIQTQDWQYWEFLFTCSSQACLEVTGFLIYQMQYLKREGITTKTKWLYDYGNSTTWAENQKTYRKAASALSENRFMITAKSGIDSL